MIGGRRPLGPPPGPSHLEKVLANLQAAEIPWVAPMQAVVVVAERWRLDGVEGDTSPKPGEVFRVVEVVPPVSEAGVYLRGHPSGTYADRCVPDPRDRATFLLLCDEAERRGIEDVAPPGDHGIVVPLDDARELTYRWNDPDDRALTMEWLAGRLAATKPRTVAGG